MARLTDAREALLSPMERRSLFRSMLLFRLALITLLFCVACWMGCALFGPISFTDQRPIAFWVIPAGIIALVYYIYGLLTEFTDDPVTDRWWRICASLFLLCPMVVYFTVAGMMYLFFTISAVEFSLDALPFVGG